MKMMPRIHSNLKHGRLGFGKGFLVRVPDGHVMQVIQR